MIIAVDFDGTIVQHPNSNKLMENVSDTLKYIKNQGNTLILNTCRCGIQMNMCIDILKANNIYEYFDYINQNSKELIDHYKVEARKISADMYIDDRNFGGFPGWDAIKEYFIDTGFIPAILH